MCGAVNHHATFFPIHVAMPLVLRCVELPFFGTAIFTVVGSVGGVRRAGMGCRAAVHEDLLSLQRRPNFPTYAPHVKVEVV